MHPSLERGKKDTFEGAFDMWPLKDEAADFGALEPPIENIWVMS